MLVAEATCAHCGLGLAAGTAPPATDPAYCCAGCETAAAVIRQSGLSGFYALPERTARPVTPSDHSYTEFDHEAFRAAHVRTLRGGLRQVTLYLEGVHCASCVWLVERVPLAVPGAVHAELDVTRGLARLTWDDAATTLSAIARFLDRIGYRPHPFRGRGADDARRAEERAMLVRIGVAGAIAANVMSIALALYSGFLDGMDASFVRYFRWLSLALVTPALLWPGRTFFRSAWAALRAGGLHMDVPIALALAAGYAQGVVNTWRDAGPIYFDAVATLVFLLLVGRYLQHRAQRTAADSAALLGALSPATARVVSLGGNGEPGAVREVPLEAVVPGMLLEVRAGDTLAADGVVERGSSSLDLGMLTGESRPESVGPGDEVWAGTVNLAATLRVRVTTSGSASRLGRLLHDVEEGARERAPVVLLADRVAGGFIALVLVLAAATVGLWWSRDPYAAIDHAIALLVVTCPCALAMATPLTITVAIGRAARRGILIKGGHALEALTVPGTLFLDKTGTLTEGRLSLDRWEGPDDVRALVLAVERGSRHPIAAAVEAWAGRLGDGFGPVQWRRETLGAGVEGVVRGHHVIVGNPAWVRSRASAGLDSSVARAADTGLTAVLVAVDGEVVARAAFDDPLRESAPGMVRRLRDRGWDVRILSGDSPDVVARVAATLGLPAHAAEGGATPERKREVVRAMARTSHAVMVGDGVNDAAAISLATVGIAVRGGAEASMAAADVYLGRGGIAALVELFDGAARTTGIIKRNMLIAIAYNAIGVTLAMTGVIDPLFAAILMPLSSLTVLLGAWQGRTFTRAQVAP